VSPRIAALEIRECFIDVIMSSVDRAREPPAAISGPVATAPLAQGYGNGAGLWGELPVTSAHFIVKRTLRIPPEC
jgi:2-methylcitrate dehydratase PrpD